MNRPRRPAWLRRSARGACLWLACSAGLVGMRVRAEPPVGYSEVHTLELESQRMLALQARAEFDKGQYIEASAHFERLARAAPGNLEPLYNQACALTQLGDLAGAYALVRTVLRTDLVEYERLYRTDTDLIALRTSAYGKRLDAEVERTRKSVRSALRQGTPAIRYNLYRPTDRRADGDLRFQPGVYLHATRRFVPLTSETDNNDVGSALVSLDHRVAYGVRSKIDEVLVLASAAPTDLESQSIRLPSGSEVEVAPARGGAWWRHVRGWDDMPLSNPRSRFEQRSVPDRPEPWNFLAAVPEGATPRAFPGAGARLRLGSAGVLLTFEKAGDFVSGRMLHSGRRTVALSPRHALGAVQWIVPTPSGGPGLVISILRCQASQVGCDRSGYGHAIDVIDSASLSHPWLHGAGTAVALIDRSGAVYVQLSSEASWSTLRRYARAGSPTFESIMPGVLLVAAPPGAAPPAGEAPLPLSRGYELGDPFALEPLRPSYGRAEDAEEPR